MSEGFIRLPTDDIGKRVRALYTSISGNDTYVEVLALADQSGNIITLDNRFPVQVSGQGVFLPATQVVKVSGEYVVIVSGQTVQLPATQVIQVSGQGMFLPSTQAVKTSGEIAIIASGVVIHKGLLSGLQTINESISGVGVFLPTTQVIKVSGEATQPTRYLPTTASGSPVIISGGVGWMLVDADGRVDAHIASGEVTLPSTQVVKISGEQIVVASGVVIHRGLLSGLGVVAGSISGQGTFLPATQIIKISGEKVSIESGQTIQLPSTQQVQISGQGAFLPSTQVVKTSGEFVEIVSGQIVRLPSTQIILVSGQGTFLPSTQVIKVSGESIVTYKEADTLFLFSGYGTTNTVTTSGFGFTTKEQGTIQLIHQGGGSGINYSVVGYVISGILPHVITSSTIYSGGSIIETITDAYSWLAIGVDSKQDNFSGQVTVVVARR